MRPFSRNIINISSSTSCLTAERSSVPSTTCCPQNVAIRKDNARPAVKSRHRHVLKRSLSLGTYPASRNTLTCRNIHTSTTTSTREPATGSIPSLPSAWEHPFPTYHTMYPCLRLPIEEASMVVIATDVLQRELAVCMSLIDEYLDHLCDPKKNTVPPTYAAYVSEFKPSITDLKSLPTPSQVIYYDYDAHSGLPVPTNILPHFTPAGAPPNLSTQRALDHNPYVNNLTAPRPSLRALAASTFLSAPILSLSALGLTPLGLLHAAGYSHEHMPREYRLLGPVMGNMYHDAASVHDMDKVRVLFSQSNDSGADSHGDPSSTLSRLLQALNMTEAEARAHTASVQRIAADYKEAREYKRQSAAKLLQRVLCERLRASGVRLCVFVGEGDEREEDMWREGVVAEQVVEEAVRRCLAAGETAERERGLGMAGEKKEGKKMEGREGAKEVITGLRGLSNVTKMEVCAGLWASPQLSVHLQAEREKMEGLGGKSRGKSGKSKSHGDSGSGSGWDETGWGISPGNLSFLQRVVGGVEAGWVDNELMAEVLRGSREGSIYACELVDTRRGDGTMKGKREVKVLRKRGMEGSKRSQAVEEESESESDVEVDVEDGMVVVHHRSDGNADASASIGGIYGEGMTHDPNFASLGGTEVAEDSDDDAAFFTRPRTRTEAQTAAAAVLQDLLLPLPAPTPARQLALASLYTDFGPLVEVDFVQGLGRQKRLLGNFNPKSPLVQSVLGARNAKAAKPTLPTRGVAVLPADGETGVGGKDGRGPGGKGLDVGLSFWERLDAEDAKKQEKNALGKPKIRALAAEIVPEAVALQRAVEAQEKRLLKARKHEQEMREQKERRQQKLREKMESMKAVAEREGVGADVSLNANTTATEEVDEDEAVEGGREKKNKKSKDGEKDGDQVSTEEGKLVVDPVTGQIKRVYRILDVTGGFGTDAFVVASSVRQNSDVDVELTLVERNPVMFVLLSDGVRRAQQTGEVYVPGMGLPDDKREKKGKEKGKRLRVDAEAEYGYLDARHAANEDVDVTLGANVDADVGEGKEGDVVSGSTHQHTRTHIGGVGALAKEEEENLRLVLGDMPIDSESGIPRFFTSTRKTNVEGGQGKGDSAVGIGGYDKGDDDILFADKDTDVITDILTTRVPIPSFRAAVGTHHSDEAQHIATIAEETLFNYIRSGMGEDNDTRKSSSSSSSSASSSSSFDVVVAGEADKQAHAKLRTGTNRARFAHFARASDLHQADVAVIARRMRVLHGDSVEYLARHATKISDGDTTRQLLLQPHNELLMPFVEYAQLASVSGSGAADLNAESNKSFAPSASTLPPVPTTLLQKYSRSLLAHNNAHSPFSQTSVLSQLHAAGAIAPLSPNHRQYDVVYMDPFYPSKQAGKHAKNKKRLRNTKLMGFAKLLRDIDEHQAFVRKGVAIDHRYGHKSDGTYTLVTNVTAATAFSPRNITSNVSAATSTPASTSSASDRIPEASAVTAEEGAKSSAAAVASSPPLLHSAEAAWVLRVCVDVLQQRHDATQTWNAAVDGGEVAGKGKSNQKVLQRRRELQHALLTVLPELLHAIPFPYAHSVAPAASTTITRDTANGVSDSVGEACAGAVLSSSPERTSRLRVLPLAPPPPTYRTEPYNTELMCVLARLAALLRVVVKRPKHAPVMFKEEAMSFKDRKTRFDVVPPVGGRKEAKRLLTQTLDRMIKED